MDASATFFHGTHPRLLRHPFDLPAFVVVSPLAARVSPMATARPSADYKQINLSEPALKHHDFATADHSAHSPRPSNVNAGDDTDTESNSSDEFDWSEDEDDAEQGDRRLGKTKARRGRALWLAFMKLARPLRIFLVGILGMCLFQLFDPPPDHVVQDVVFSSHRSCSSHSPCNGVC
jgi:hypothetical protein